MKKIIKYKWNILFFVIILVLMAGSNSADFSLKLNSNDVQMTYFYIGLLIIGFVWLLIKLVKKDILFGENELILVKKLFGLKFKGRKYPYESITGFIIGRFANYKSQEYHIYIDHNNNIVNLLVCETYKDCIKITEQIKEKAQKPVYDITDENYRSEEDLFRNYYKLKSAVKELYK
jgi:hypothetical protein